MEIVVGYCPSRLIHKMVKYKHRMRMGLVLLSCWVYLSCFNHHRVQYIAFSFLLRVSFLPFFLSFYFPPRLHPSIGSPKFSQPTCPSSSYLTPSSMRHSPHNTNTTAMCCWIPEGGKEWTERDGWYLNETMAWTCVCAIYMLFRIGHSLGKCLEDYTWGERGGFADLPMVIDEWKCGKS